MGNQQTIVNEPIYTFDEWNSMCTRAAKELPKSERPSLNNKIEDLLEENPIESIVDLEE